MGVSSALKKLSISSSVAVFVGLGIGGATPAQAVTFNFSGTTSSFGNFEGSYTLDDAAIGQNVINASSISNFNLNLGGVSLVAGESPASGAVNFSLPFTGGIADFDNVLGNLSFLSGTSFTFGNNRTITGTNPLVNGGNPIVGQISATQVVPEPGTVAGLASLGLMSVLMLKKKSSDAGRA